MKKLIAALGNVLRDKRMDAAFKAMIFALPSESELGLALQAEKKLIDVDPLYAARRKMVVTIADALRKDFEAVHKSLAKLGPREVDGVSMGKRSLKNLCVAYLAAKHDKKDLAHVFATAKTAENRNMTDHVSALGILSETDSPLRTKALAAFDKRWRKNAAVMDSWFAVQAGARRTDALAQTKKLMKHPGFDIKNPNRISALIGAFARNGLGFHAKDGSGYRFIGDMVLKIDSFNPHSSAGLAKAFVRWRDYDVKRQKLMQAELKRLGKVKKLSKNVAEIVAKSLKSR